MAEQERDSTQDWLLPEEAIPPSVSELEQRIEKALAVAKRAEAAVESVGAVAIDAAERSRQAAEQARRAAELAEQASTTLREELAGAGAAGREGPGPGRRRREDPAGSTQGQPAPPMSRGLAEAPPLSESLQSFTARADRIVARLRQLERLPEMATGETLH